MRKPGLIYDSRGRPIGDGPQRPIGLARAEDALRQLVFANQVILFTLKKNSPDPDFNAHAVPSITPLTWVWRAGLSRPHFASRIAEQIKSYFPATRHARHTQAGPTGVQRGSEGQKGWVG